MLTSALFSTPAMDAVFADGARLQAMLDVEAALAAAEADAGVIPQAAVAAIEDACRSELYDPKAIAVAAALAGNLAIPLVKALTTRVAEADADAAGWVHWGVTSQDVIDTGLVLQALSATALLHADLLRLEAALAEQARRHRDLAMPGRTWLQQATPVTFGLKAAGALDAVRRARRRLDAAAEEARVLQFGGAAGTLASLGDRGLAVAERLAARLDLALPPIPWHAHRQRIADLGCALAAVCGVMGKLGRDLSLLMQTEVGEAFEPAAAGKGGSSTMPHKRNPVACAVALQASVRAPGLAATLLAALPQEHERGLGGWQAEWETLPELFRLAAAVSAMADAWSGLEVKPEAMAANLTLNQGVAMAEAASQALGRTLGKAKAHVMVEAAARLALAEDRPFAAVLAEDEAAAQALGGADAIAALLNPQRYLGSTGAFIDAVLAQEGGHG